MYLVRPATVADVGAIVHHRHAMFTEMEVPGDYGTMDREFAAWVENAMRNSIYYGWLAVADRGEVAAGGGLSLLPSPPNPIDPSGELAFVYNVYTEPAHRRKGLARTIMNVIHDWCRKRGVKTIALHASDFGRPLYASLGYRSTSEMRLAL